MTQISFEHPTPVWTFADLASTYRFWALIGASALTVLGFTLMRHYMFLSSGGRLLSISGMFSGLGSFWGIPLGLLLARSKTTSRLLAALVVCMAFNTGALVLDQEEQGSLTRLAKWANQATMVALGIALPSLLAGWAKDRIAVVSALAVLVSWYLVVELLVELRLGFGDFGISNFAMGLAGLAALFTATALLASIHKQHLESTPRPYHHPLTPRRRNAVRVMLMTALPWVTALGFVLLPVMDKPTSPAFAKIVALAMLAACPVGMGLTAYWLYRIHGEMASVNPTAKPLTPKAALWIYVFVPLSLPMLLINFGEVLRDRLGRRDPPSQRSAIWFNVCSILLPPVAMGIVQAKLNAEIRNSSG